MTPKEKAKELIDTYLDIENKFNVDLFCDECGIERAAKYCALIAVDEMIVLIGEIAHTSDEYYLNRNELLEIKQEIENL
jgi:hypothetical protein